MSARAIQRGSRRSARQAWTAWKRVTSSAWSSSRPSLLVVAGCFNVIYGIVAIANSHVFTANTWKPPSTTARGQAAEAPDLRVTPAAR
jgi:hypothetical protein